MPGPESNFWQSLKRSIPKDCLATRLENRAGGGIPDVHVLLDGLPFWLELKTTKGNLVKPSAHQIAWHCAYSARKGLSYFLVRHSSTKNIHLFQGFRAQDLASMSIHDVECVNFTRTDKLWEYLRSEVRAHYLDLLG